MVEVIKIGENTIAPPHLQLNVLTHNYMYLRMVDGITQTSFSNDLNELKERMRCELE